MRAGEKSQWAEHGLCMQEAWVWSPDTTWFPKHCQESTAKNDLPHQFLRWEGSSTAVGTHTWQARTMAPHTTLSMTGCSTRDLQAPLGVALGPHLWGDMGTLNTRRLSSTTASGPCIKTLASVG